MTHETMEDVDAGRVIDHQAIQAWFDSLRADKPLPSPVQCLFSEPAKRRQTWSVCTSI